MYARRHNGNDGRENGIFRLDMLQYHQANNTIIFLCDAFLVHASRASRASRSSDADTSHSTCASSRAGCVCLGRYKYEDFGLAKRMDPVR